MSYEQIKCKLSVILCDDDLKRLSSSTSCSGGLVLDVDLHGLSRKQGQRLVRNIININKGEMFVINVIHGFNHGTVLKEMVMEEGWGARVISRESPSWNPGQTFMTIAA